MFGLDHVQIYLIEYYSTHPVFASLDHPLFACGGKRVKKKERKPLYARSGERGDERSDVGVSRRRCTHQ